MTNTGDGLMLSGMWSFDDFDAWGQAVSGAHLRLACDGIEKPIWTLGITDLDGIILQVASEGGGNVCYGANTHAGPTLFVPLTHAAEHVVNGVALDDASLFAIPRGGDFSIRVRRRAHAWCSIALPAETPIASATRRGSERVTCRPGTVPRLRQLVHEISTALHDMPRTTAAHRAAGVALEAAAVDCVAAPLPPRIVQGRPRRDRDIVIRRAMAAIEVASVLPTAAELARLVGVNDRTLLRIFREAFGLPPKRYLLLRQLHRIRQILIRGAAADETVANILTRHGIWEFGRFAGRYRRHFGEPPSETLRRSRG